MRVIISFIIFLLAFSGMSLGAGLPMMYKLTPGGESNVILANLIQESLSGDPSGFGVIRGSKCTTPNDYLVATQTYHPSAKLGNVSELPAYIRGLRQEKLSDVSRMRKLSRIMYSKGKCELDLEGWSREIRLNEFVWTDVNTGEVILAGDCMNVVANSLKEPSVLSETPFPVVTRKSPSVVVALPTTRIAFNIWGGSARLSCNWQSRDMSDEIFRLWRRGEVARWVGSEEFIVRFYGADDNFVAPSGGKRVKKFMSLYTEYIVMVSNGRFELPVDYRWIGKKGWMVIKPKNPGNFYYPNPDPEYDTQWSGKIKTEPGELWRGFTGQLGGDKITAEIHFGHI